jgi:hypothetical protein
LRASSQTRVQGRCQVVRADGDPSAVIVVRLICTDQDCAVVLEQFVPTLAELDALACECGCTLHVIEVAEWEPAAPGLGRRVLAHAA